MRAFRAAHLATREQNQPEPIPNRLYHYTTLSGLLGITSTGVMWASDARFMNDASELNYASELIDEVVQGVLDEVTNEDLTPVLPRRKGFANPFQYPLVQPFIACFCEQGDLLSQWMAYGKGDAPVSLGFDLSSMSTFGDLPPNTILKKVLYEESEQRERIRQVTRAWVDTAESLLNSEEDLQATDLFPYPAIWALQDALAAEHLHFKNPVFAQEEEWRLIKLVNVYGELRRLEDERRQDRMAGRVRGCGV